MQQLVQRPQCQPTLPDKCVMLPQHHLDDSNSIRARNHWASFLKYVAFQRRQGSINTFDQFENMLA